MYAPTVPKGQNIADRLRLFASSAIELTDALPKSHTCTHITRQLIRSSTAGGANYEEARGAESRQDFVHKLRLADKEMRESLYWLSLIGTRWPEQFAQVDVLVREGNELVAILTASMRTARKRGMVNEERVNVEPGNGSKGGNQGTG